MNWNIISVTLAVFWLCAGLGILWIEYRTGKSLFGPPGLLISPAWLCLIVAAYNIIRVVLSLKYARKAEDDDEPFSQRPIRVAPEEKGEDRGSRIEDRGLRSP